MAKTKGGRKKTDTNLETRRKQYDGMSESAKSATKRPGSHKK